MKVTVTQEHINKGTARQPGTCPVALALIDKGFARALVDRRTARVRGIVIGDYETYRLPKTAGDFIFAYDTKNMPVQPFSFTMRHVPSSD